MLSNVCCERHQAVVSPSVRAALQGLLLELLAGVRRHGETPLLEAINSQGIVQAAWPKYETELTVGQTAGVNVGRALDGVLESLWSDGDGPHGALASHAADREPGASLNDLANWLELFYKRMLEVHPRSIEAITFRLEGCDYRDTARRLGLTTRLARRILADMGDAWRARTGG